MLRHLKKPVYAVLRWQLAATIVLAVVAAWFSGVHGAVSAAAGGLVSISAGLAAAFVASRGDTKSAGGLVAGALRAEGVKIGLIAVLLWLVLKTYAEVVVIAFIASFLVTVLIFAMAFFVRDP
jgi:ATP synthase protein I